MEEGIQPNSFLILKNDVASESTIATGNTRLTSLQRITVIAETLAPSTWNPTGKAISRTKSILRKNGVKKNLTVTFKEEAKEVPKKSWVFKKKKEEEVTVIKPRGMHAFMKHAREGKKWLQESLSLGLTYPKTRSRLTAREVKEESKIKERSVKQEMVKVAQKENVDLDPKIVEAIDDEAHTSDCPSHSSSNNEYTYIGSLKRKSLLKEEFNNNEQYLRIDHSWKPHYSNDRVVFSNGLNNIEDINDFEVDLPIYANGADYDNQKRYYQSGPTGNNYSHYQNSFEKMNSFDGGQVYNQFPQNLSYDYSHIYSANEKLEKINMELSKIPRFKFSEFSSFNANTNEYENMNALSNVNDDEEVGYYDVIDSYVDTNVIDPCGLNENVQVSRSTLEVPKSAVTVSVGTDDISSDFDIISEKRKARKERRISKLNNFVDQQLEMLSKDSNIHFTQVLSSVELLLDTQINAMQGSVISGSTSPGITFESERKFEKDNDADRDFENIEFSIIMSTILVPPETGDFISKHFDEQKTLDPGPKSFGSDADCSSLSRTNSFKVAFQNLKTKLKRSQSFAKLIGIKKELDKDSKEIKRSKSFAKFREFLKKKPEEKENVSIRSSDNEVQDFYFRKINEDAIHSRTSDDTSIESLVDSNLGFARLKRDEDSQQRFYSLDRSDSD
jgi:hypothetical protein